MNLDVLTIELNRGFCWMCKFGLVFLDAWSIGMFKVQALIYIASEIATYISEVKKNLEG